mmetsp:Transcript_18854/g.26264  ORF Transcript_18854/g.26264 Transcript_18854/m.26264 type:complete len:140 (-) Transcript_18854:512-931(-)
MIYSHRELNDLKISTNKKLYSCVDCFLITTPLAFVIYQRSDCVVVFRVWCTTWSAKLWSFCLNQSHGFWADEIQPGTSLERQPSELSVSYPRFESSEQLKLICLCLLTTMVRKVGFCPSGLANAMSSSYSCDLDAQILL